jgi:DNA-binding MarR family transcriptional regulator
MVGFASAGYSISPEQWSILVQLWRQDGLTQQVLADHFHRSKVAAFHLISKVEAQGLVERRPNPSDGRSNLIYLTPRGRAIVDQLIPLAQGNLDRALAGIPAADVETTRRVLSRISENLGARPSPRFLETTHARFSKPAEKPLRR